MRERVRMVVRCLLAGIFVFAGVVHLVRAEIFLPIMPPWIPWHLGCVLVSGVFEILGGVGLLVPMAGVRRWAGVGLVLLLIAVFPANIYMAMAHVQVHGIPSQPWMASARLPLQPILIAMVWWVSGMPFHRRS